MRKSLDMSDKNKTVVPVKFLERPMSESMTHFLTASRGSAAEPAELPSAILGTKSTLH